MSAFFCLFLCFRSYSEKLEVYTPTYYKIRYILDELYVAVLWIISWIIIYVVGFFYQKRQLLTKKSEFVVTGFVVLYDEQVTVFP